MKMGFERMKRGPQKKTLAYYAMINAVLEETYAAGYRLTARQLFYQLVARNLVKNTKASYDYLLPKLRDGRMREYVDWDYIEDRLREVTIPLAFEDVSEALSTLQDQYRLDRQENQPYRIEIWAEKDSVSQVLAPVAEEYGLPFLVGRGQFSVSCLFETRKRWLEDGRPVRVLFFGDHDPTGILSIEKNVRETMLDMAPEIDQKIIRVAVPTNPDYLVLLQPNVIKEKDVNTKKYRKLYGTKCWELEAMDPADIKDLLVRVLERFLVLESYQEILAQEDKDKVRLKELLND